MKAGGEKERRGEGRKGDGRMSDKGKGMRGDARSFVFLVVGRWLVA